jgi:Kae1-associated kinase Bud32
MNKLISQGAEAKIFLDKKVVTKDRTPKGYRHPELDKQIRIRRTRSESKILIKALGAGANIPKVIKTDKFNIEIEFIDGDRLSETLNDYPEKKQFEVMKKLGEQVATLHKNDLIHGDLTTSNTILKDKEVFIIDFGLGFVSTKLEDKAVDLHLIKQALEAKHWKNHEDLFKEFTKGYKHKETKQITERLIVVEKRGRYKH